VVAAACLLLYKEFSLLCFDEGYAGAQGWPVGRLDVVMMALVTVVTVIGLQAVGLILVIAMLIIPAAAARFWTHHLARMLVASALIGATCGWLGASLSALVPRLPAGAVIVVVAAVIFTMSMIIGPARGVLFRLLRHRRLVRTVGRQHLLRALYERLETVGGRRGATLGELLSMRSWSNWSLRRELQRAARGGLVVPIATEPDRFRLTEAGQRDAARIVRNHRLWELYLITHADIAPSHVDRDADQIEHVLGPQLVARLERKLGLGAMEQPPPPSPHAIRRRVGAPSRGASSTEAG
jgi:manganese/zinc/iron transport system permease protein